MSKTSAKKKLGDIIKEMIGRPAPVEMLEGWQGVIDQMAEGEQAPVIAELIAMKVLRFAVHPDRPNQWAVELVFDRVDGKAIQQAAGDGRDVIEERLDDISRQHLDDIAALCKVTAGSDEAQDRAAGQVANPLDTLPSHRSGNPQAAQGEPPMEDGPEEERG